MNQSYEVMPWEFLPAQVGDSLGLSILCWKQWIHSDQWSGGYRRLFPFYSLIGHSHISAYMHSCFLWNHHYWEDRRVGPLALSIMSSSCRFLTSASTCLQIWKGSLRNFWASGLALLLTFNFAVLSFILPSHSNQSLYSSTMWSTGGVDTQMHSSLRSVAVFKANQVSILSELKQHRIVRMMYYWKWHSHTRKKDIQVLLSGVEPKTFQLLVPVLYHRATGDSRELRPLN